MKSPEEIQRAHDLIHFAGTPEAPPIFDAVGSIACHAAHDVLAWVLGFECGEQFESNLEGIAEALAAAGYVARKPGEPS